MVSLGLELTNLSFILANLDVPWDVQYVMALEADHTRRLLPDTDAQLRDLEAVVSLAEDHRRLCAPAEAVESRIFHLGNDHGKIRMEKRGMP